MVAILNFFGGHFDFFCTDSCSPQKAVETKWSLFFDLTFFSPSTRPVVISRNDKREVRIGLGLKQA